MKEKFTVLIMHGRSNEYKKVKQLIFDEGFRPIVLKEIYTGDFLLERVKKAVWKEAHCAVIVMTPDDKVNGNDNVNKTARFRARQNVIFELGYCMGAFDSIPKKYWYNAVIMLKEQSIENLSDIEGLEFVGFKNSLKATDLNRLRRILKNTYKKADSYYDLE